MWRRVGRGIALLFHDRGTRRGCVVSSTPRPHFTPGKDPVPILQEAGWTPGPVWKGGKSRPHRDWIPDRPARSQSLYRLSYPAHPHTHTRARTHAHTHIYIYMIIQGDSGERTIFWEVVVSVVMKKRSYERVSSSEYLPRESCLNLQIQTYQRTVNGNHERQVTYVNSTLILNYCLNDRLVQFT